MASHEGIICGMMTANDNDCHFETSKTIISIVVGENMLAMEYGKSVGQLLAHRIVEPDRYASHKKWTVGKDCLIKWDFFLHCSSCSRD